jgi:hypothetical protein
MINFKQVYEGWKNMLVPSAELKETIEKVSTVRLAICNNCPHHSKYHKTLRPDDHCTDCGCMLNAKVACMSCECPKRFWLAELDNPEEENDLNIRL